MTQFVERIGLATASPSSRLAAIALIVERREIGHARHYLGLFLFDVPRLTAGDRKTIEAISTSLGANESPDTASELRVLAASLNARPEMQLAPQASRTSRFADMLDARARDALRCAEVEAHAGRAESRAVFLRMHRDDVASARDLRGYAGPPIAAAPARSRGDQKPGTRRTRVFGTSFGNTR